MAINFEKEIVRVANVFSGKIDEILNLLAVNGRLNLGKVIKIQSTVRLANQFALMIEEAGFDRFLEGFVNEFNGSIAEVNKALTAAGLEVRFGKGDLALLEEVRRISVNELRISSAQFMTVLEKEVVNAALSGKTVGQVSASLKRMIEAKFVSSNHIPTLADTAVTRFRRTMVVRKGVEAGVDRFEYVGPNDQVTRDFCLDVLFAQFSGDRIGFSVDEINALDNHQTGSVLTDGGGFNCRHDWLPIT